MGEIAPEEQFFPLSTIFYYLMLDFYVNTGIRFSLRDKRLFEITEVEITRVDCTDTYIGWLELPLTGTKASSLFKTTHFHIFNCMFNLLNNTCFVSFFSFYPVLVTIFRMGSFISI